MKKSKKRKRSSKSMKKSFTIIFQNEIIDDEPKNTNNEENNAPPSSNEDNHLKNERKPLQTLKGLKEIEWFWRLLLATIVAVAVIVSMLCHNGGATTDQGTIENLVGWLLNDELSASLYCMAVSLMQK